MVHSSFPSKKLQVVEIDRHLYTTWNRQLNRLRFPYKIYDSGNVGNKVLRTEEPKESLENATSSGDQTWDSRIPLVAHPVLQSRALQTELLWWVLGCKGFKFLGLESSMK